MLRHFYRAGRPQIGSSSTAVIWQRLPAHAQEHFPAAAGDGSKQADIKASLHGECDNPAQAAVGGGRLASPTPGQLAKGQGGDDQHSPTALWAVTGVPGPERERAATHAVSARRKGPLQKTPPSGVCPGSMRPKPSGIARPVLHHGAQAHDHQGGL
ncbi:uncharacterized protein BDZ99DRAFT_244200 [Mytilinidion resinicola]|uniref:Uncharacterized protein n=1 Tax=Mytilinidion resinicola TaxID=574789 RepID=A0A6A6YVU2_9PEZI|nr:uncharacterized protein BDZ99DRAFT_244200 [Mytilinidion resinicola]KAF2812890.1 hypothetical protein BDZ99DRAFT_244200 [Mytilinidion resinicola]